MTWGVKACGADKYFRSVSLYRHANRFNLSSATGEFLHVVCGMERTVKFYVPWPRRPIESIIA